MTRYRLRLEKLEARMTPTLTAGQRYEACLRLVILEDEKERKERARALSTTTTEKESA